MEFLDPFLVKQTLPFAQYEQVKTVSIFYFFSYRYLQKTCDCVLHDFAETDDKCLKTYNKSDQKFDLNTVKKICVRASVGDDYANTTHANIVCSCSSCWLCRHSVCEVIHYADMTMTMRPSTANSEGLSLTWKEQ